MPLGFAPIASRAICELPTAALILQSAVIIDIICFESLVIDATWFEQLVVDPPTFPGVDDEASSEAPP